MKLSFSATLLILPFLCLKSLAQTTERPRPEEWKNLVLGGRFMDRFMPMTNNGKPSRSNVWGADNVLPRYVENGIEDTAWSFWCANIVHDRNKYHMFVVGWPEKSPSGHATWPNSILFHAVASNRIGPFVLQDTIGMGHNAEAFRLKSGQWIVYVIDGYYSAGNVKGPWTFKKFDFQNQDRDVMDGMSNCTFAQREDGSYMMINRGGGTWYSQTGTTPYYQISDRSAYPPVKGNFEDPVIWRDNVQYNLIVNDWLGRIAYYLRSKYGVEWKIEAGEAYLPGIAKHADGTVEGWYKFERMRVFQDRYGRAIQANFSVIDVEKNLDKGNDSHSSKSIAIPLLPGRLLTILDTTKVTSGTKTFRIKIVAEKGFDPKKDVDITSLHFGESEEVNFGRGATRIINTAYSGKDMIVTFDAQGLAIPEDDYVAKLIGKTKDGKLLYGYARLPWVSFTDPILSSRLPVVTFLGNRILLKIEVRNFGQYISRSAEISVYCNQGGRDIFLAKGNLPPLKPFEKRSISMVANGVFKNDTTYSVVVRINQKDIKPVLLHGELKLSK